MEIIKKNINMNHICGKAGLQITLNDDFIVPDSKSDIYKKITDNGEIIVENIRLGEGKAGVTGRLRFSVLYQTENASPGYDCMEGNIDFNENVGINGLEAGDTVKCSAILEDLTITLINSRKISVSAIMSLEVYGENTYVSPAAVDIEDTGVCFLKKNIELLSLVENKRDILRVREQHELATNKPNMGNIVWSATELRNLETKATSGELAVKGEIYVFAIYMPEEAGENLQYLEEVLPFVGKLPLVGANENMIADVCVTPSQKTVSVKPDYDGEPRVLEAEVVMDLDIKLYEEQNVSLITDVYSTQTDLVPVYSPAQYDELLVRNHSRCRIGDKFKLTDHKDKVLQIINSSATISVDDIAVVDDGLMTEGAAKVTILYISDNDNERIGCLTKQIPFSYKIDAAGITPASFYTVKSTLEQLSTSMLGSDELEVKISIGLDALVLNPMEAEAITDIEEHTPDYARLKKLPGMCGHIVKEGDTLWDIAKDHHTTMDKIIETNNLSSENVKPGMKLLIIKQAV